MRPDLGKQPDQGMLATWPNQRDFAISQGEGESADRGGHGVALSPTHTEIRGAGWILGDVGDLDAGELFFGEVLDLVFDMANDALTSDISFVLAQTFDSFQQAVFEGAVEVLPSLKRAALFAAQDHTAEHSHLQIHALRKSVHQKTTPSFGRGRDAHLKVESPRLVMEAVCGFGWWE